MSKQAKVNCIYDNYHNIYITFPDCIYLFLFFIYLFLVVLRINSKALCMYVCPPPLAIYKALRTHTLTHSLSLSVSLLCGVTVYVCVSTHVYMHRHMVGRYQWGNFLNNFPLYCLTQSLSLYLKLTDLTRLTGKRALGILFSLPPQLWITSKCYDPLFTWMLRI